MSELNKIKRVGLCVCGGIAAYKAVEILRGLQKNGVRVSVAMTKHATEFVQPLTFRALTEEYVLVDDYEKENPDPIAHINFAQNIDLMLVAPATANVIGKFANGIADDFVSTAYLATTAPVLIAPAMNTQMWFHAATQRNLTQLKNDGAQFVEPDDGEMACKTIGPGRLSEPETIVRRALEVLEREKGRKGEREKNPDSASDLTGETILITAGATREELDPVRFISNYSSGKMGFAIAEAARNRGARVILVYGAATAKPPENVEIINAVSAAEMHSAVLANLAASTVYIGAAAIADYRPKIRSSEKIKKSGDNYVLELEKTPDILADVSAKRHDKLIVVGFAAETEKVLEHAQIKLERKNLDMIIANDVSRSDSGFGADNNQITILTRGGAAVESPLMLKSDAADLILDEIAKLRAAK